MKLSHIDSKRIDGKFLSADGSIPEGQGAVIGLLEDCYELLDDMRDAMEAMDEMKPVEVNT